MASPLAHTLRVSAQSDSPAPGGVELVAALRARLDAALSNEEGLQFGGNSALEGPTQIGGS